MGLFGRKKKSPPSCVVSIGAEWERPSDASYVNVNGAARAKVYLYNAFPLDGAAVPAMLSVEPRDYVLRSVHNGTVVDTAEEGRVPVSYNGEVVGTIALSRYHVMRLAKAGKVLTFGCTADAMLDLGIPDLYAMVPESPTWLRDMT